MYTLTSLRWRELITKGKESSVPLLDEDKDGTDEASRKLKTATEMRDKAKTNDEKLKAAKAFEEAKANLKAVCLRLCSTIVINMPQMQKLRFQNKHMYKTTPSKASVESRIEKWTDDIRKLEVDINNRDENKEVALGTSKINYMDPRISVAWCKRNEVPIDKIFAKTLRDKFNWAMAVPPDWKFE